MISSQLGTLARLAPRRAGFFLGSAGVSSVAAGSADAPSAAGAG